MTQLFLPGIEEWRDVPGFPGYQASSLGRVRSNKRTPNKQGWKLLKTPPCQDGYLQCPLRGPDGKTYNSRVHRIVALTFLGLRPPGHVAHHKDENPAHNWWTNLEYKLRGKHTIDHLSHLCAEEREEMRAIYMDHEHDLSKLAALFGVSVEVTERAVADLVAVFGAEQE